MKRRAVFPYILAAGLLAGSFVFACGEVTLHPDTYGGPWEAGARPVPVATVTTDAETSEGLEDSFVSEDGGEASVTSCTTCTVIASAENPQSLALDSSNVYWTDEGPTTNGEAGQGAGSIMSTPRTSMMAMGTTIASPYTGPLIIACANDWLVWSAVGSGANQGSVSVMGTASTGVVMPATTLTAPWGVALDQANAYWVAGNGGGTGMVLQAAPLQTGTAPIFAAVSGDYTPGGLAVNGSNLFFAAWGSNGGGAVFQAAVTGGTPAPIWTTPSGHPQDVAVDANNIYWLDEGAGILYSEALTGGTVYTLASGLLSPFHIAVDSKNVYVADKGAGTILEIPIGIAIDGGNVLVLASGLDSPLAVAVDDTQAVVYFTTPSAIMSAPKM
jgi:hypothetical protein